MECHELLMLAWTQVDWRPPSSLPVSRWCEENVELDSTGPMPGRYSTSVTPMARWVFDAAQDRRTRRVVVMVSAQSSKTLIGILFLLWTIAEDPGPSMWVMANQDHCEEFAKKRLFPAVESCPLTAPLLPKERNARNKRLIQFHSMKLMMRGAFQEPLVNDNYFSPVTTIRNPQCTWFQDEALKGWLRPLRWSEGLDA